MPLWEGVWPATAPQSHLESRVRTHLRCEGVRGSKTGRCANQGFADVQALYSKVFLNTYVGSIKIVDHKLPVEIL